MKTAILFLVASLSYGMAQACLGEAQIIAEVSVVQSVDAQTDLVTINQNYQMYNENGTCPLDLGEVLQSGIQVKAGSFHHGSTISGYVVKAADGSLSLEQ